MTTYQRTTSANPEFVKLVARLDAELAERDGQEHAFYAVFNSLNSLRHVVIAINDGRAVACGAMKEYDRQTMEIKRMYTVPEQRGTGLASRILRELESWATELSCIKCILETGKRQPEAIGLYLKHGYRQTPGYGQYKEVPNSVCFEKILKVDLVSRKS